MLGACSGWAKSLLAAATVLLISCQSADFDNLRIPGPYVVNATASKPVVLGKRPEASASNYYPAIHGPVELTRGDVRDFGELIGRLKLGKRAWAPHGERELVAAFYGLFFESRQSDAEYDELRNAIEEYRVNTPDAATETAILGWLNRLIEGRTAAGSTMVPLLERLQAANPLLEAGIPQFGKQERLSPEFQYFKQVQEVCQPSDLSGARLPTRDTLRFNRVVVEDLFRRALVKSTSLKFLLHYLDDDVVELCPGQMADKHIRVSGAPFECSSKPVRRRPVRPGDVVTVLVTSGLPDGNTRAEEHKLAHSLAIGGAELVVRYLPTRIGEGRVANESRLLSLYVRSMFGKHKEAGTALKPEVLDLLSREGSASFHQVFSQRFPRFWNGLIDPGIGILSEDVHDTDLAGRSGLSARLLRVMLERGAQRPGNCREGQNGWWFQCRNDHAAYDNYFENEFQALLSICLRTTGYGNFFSDGGSSGAIDQPRARAVLYVDPNTTSDPRKRTPGIVLQTDVARASFTWADNARLSRPWSLREWEVSRVLGAFEPRVTSLFFAQTAGSDKVVEVQIAWPNDTRAPTVALRPRADRRVELQRLLPGADVPLIIDYRDLRLLARPALPAPTDSAADADDYLADMPVGLRLTTSGRRVDLRSANSTGKHVFTDSLWDDQRGWTRQLAAAEWPHRTVVPTLSVLEALASYATSVDGWARYRLPSPEVNTTVTAVEIAGIGRIAVTENLAHANRRVTIERLPGLGHSSGAVAGLESGALLLRSGYYVTGGATCPNPVQDGFCPAPVDSEVAPRIFWRDLELLSAFHVSRVHGLSVTPLPGF